ncbi:cbb3-type cytochrome oxidase assembly protein CcoS [Azoarcus sp. PA01]|nr:cbb3-type cytochrome oxidase assembly protein CcoS [Azoarcus sp. PA01]
MESLYILIPLSVVLVFGIGVIFWWSLKSGQYDDMEGPAYRVLMDDRDAPPPAEKQPDDPEREPPK